MFIDDWQTAFAEYCLIVILHTAGDKLQAERNILQAHIQNYVQIQKSRKGFDINVDLPLHIRKCTNYMENKAGFLDKEVSLDDYTDISDVD